MKVEELRIGNLIWFNDAPTKNGASIVMSISRNNVATSKGTAYLNECEPIPLTEEWLLRMEFENIMRKSEAGYKASAYMHKGKYALTVFFDNGALSVSFWRGNEKKYVHEFQNFYYALVGDELNIKDK